MPGSLHNFLSLRPIALVLLLGIALSACSPGPQPVVTVSKGSRIAIIGGNICARMLHYGHLEAAFHLRHPDSLLFIRNLCDGGDMPGFRPHPARNTPWAFPGAEAYYEELANPSHSEGHFSYPDEWLDTLNADIILAFWGYNAAQFGPDRLPTFKAELRAFIRHTLGQAYNNIHPPQLILVTPTAIQDLSATADLPKGHRQNAMLSLYTDAIQEVAVAEGVPVVDLFEPSKAWYAEGQPLTIDGLQLNDAGNQRVASYLADQLFGKSPEISVEPDTLRKAVQDKNWFWANDYKIPNSVHVYGRRYEPYGPDNYPAEIRKIRAMTAVRDTAIWKLLQGEPYDLKTADARTPYLPLVETNFKPADGLMPYQYGADAEATLTAAPGYKVELFASEKEFEDLANPVQLSFDNKGRLWVAVMPSYPHYKPGDKRPNDKILILEDTDGDGKADRQTTFADGLHLPIGFEIAPEGVYVSQGSSLVLLTDTDGDDRADRREILLGGFDDHDTHHAISAFCADPSGAIFMGEGTFLHTNVETVYGTVRGTNGGFYRYNPARHRLERTAQLAIPNPWGIAFDAWGQPFFAETSGPDVRWMSPGTIAPVYGKASPKAANIIEAAHRVRPTSGLEFVSSRHFPDEVQGDLLINNTIGFLGTKQHQMLEAGTGYSSRHRQDLLQSSDPHFRPVDMEFAPDGSLYLADWHNRLIGHMQHNARDPLRDHAHGRIYRVTYPGRPFVSPAEIDGAAVPTLLDNLKLPEYRTRYRTRRELRGRNAADVLPALRRWTVNLDTLDAGYERHLLEALWVSWGLNQVEEPLLRQLLKAKDYRVRAAAVRVLRYTGHQVADQADLLLACAGDPNGRVRLEAVVAASWLEPAVARSVLERAEQEAVDEWMEPVYAILRERLYTDRPVASAGLEATLSPGQQVYEREGSCITCHQPDGKGLTASGFPPLAGSEWVTGSKERLIKLTLKGLHGPIEVNGQTYPGQVPMTAFEGLLSDKEIADVLSYVRNAFGNSATPIAPAEVKRVRTAVAEKEGFYRPAELLGQHPK
ncbi:MAG: PVC-type heme-binding CxxCH protein [Phaeodactylibacter xiamenensis]|uniref:Dehydrogenase n=1 Tax=Phaeodactylibacter xiamenensis TaxID=1524460 RepID=A0A098SC44_9BACT|nr:PVC-type heme-binding CxxCH protein [Phaeodactylibacter xiamenensis]KGE88607.1 dehydrogenase [Phaeodactylibacter xiamenensis]MCR9050785.1 c-type cytochrome [bacterium]